ncbi:TonB-dependent receptor [Olivibacter ginsenosidimutans]|uniref:TonB-dependent receptor n=1 Tax=Olivibacter ginsenosidimutans TaxID=1176537 RepID=A0ABP9CEE3_9SPHI
MKTLLFSSLKFRYIHCLLLFPFLWLSKPVSAQQHLLEKKITLHRNAIRLSEALSAIGEQAGCTFIFSGSRMDMEHQVNLQYDDVELRQVLTALFGDKAMSFEVSNNQIAIQPAKGKGGIKGVVRTSDGQAAAFVTIAIKGLKSVRTDDAGEFSFDKIPVGVYEISASYIGLQTQQQLVQVKASQDVSLSFTLAEDAQTLQEVVVEGKRNNIFAKKESDYVARMPLKNLENPQVYSVVGQELMTEQLVTNINQALNNIPGAVASNDPAGGVGISARGFGVGVNARNGLASPVGRSTIDPVNVERIEVLKGPSATLFGNTISSYGGVVNLVTKKPYDSVGGSLSYSMGSWGLNRITADVNTPVNKDKTALFRVNTSFNRENSFMSTGHSNTFALAPSFSYQINDRLSFLVDFEFYREDRTRTPYPNISALGLHNVKDIPLDYKTNLYGDDFSGVASTYRSFISAKYQLSDKWVSTTNLSVSNTKAEASYQAYPNWINQDSIIRGMSLFGPISDTYINFQQNFNGQFNLGSIGNRIVLGLDYLHWEEDFTYAGADVDTIDIRKGYPTLGKQQANYALGLSNNAMGWTSGSDTYSVYASDVVNFTKNFLAMLSLRVDRYQQKGGYGQTALAPKLGLVYQVIGDQVSLFGNYMSSFTNNGPGAQPYGTQIVFDPEHAKQWEGGVKINVFQGNLNATLSYYNINIDDAIRYDENNFAHQDGKQKSKGFDAELISSPLPGLKLMAGYTYNNNKYIQEDAEDEGLQITGNPPNLVNFWVSYKFQSNAILQHFGLGAGGNYVDKSFYDSNNTIIIPSYFLLNTTVFYEEPKWRLGIKLNNLTNQKYWSGAVPQPLRSVVANISYKF